MTIHNLAQEMKETCLWVQDAYDEYAGAWDTACGDRFELIEGNPHQNNMHFCPFCGKRLVIKK